MRDVNAGKLETRLGAAMEEVRLLEHVEMKASFSRFNSMPRMIYKVV